MTHDIITCDGLDERLADYLDGTLDAGATAALEAHAAACARCRSLLADLRSITRDAAALPELSPSRDLWEGIAARIDAPVVPLDAARARRGVPVAPRRLPAAWLAAAAAALVLATAGVTYEWTMHHASQVAQGPVTVPTGGARTAPPAAVVAGAAPVGVQRDSQTTDSARADAAPGQARFASRSAAARNASALPAAFQPYDREIVRLRTIVAQRRHELDPKTVAVIEQNLRLIDKAIRESRAALARDPESGFLHQQLNDALGKKVELLRTVALLPARS